MGVMQFYAQLILSGQFRFCLTKHKQGFLLPSIDSTNRMLSAHMIEGRHDHSMRRDFPSSNKVPPNFETEHLTT